MYITEKRLLKWALCCNSIYVLLFFLLRPQGINITKIGVTLLLLLAVTIIFFIAIKNKKLLQEIPKFPRLLLYLILIWGGITIARDLSFSLQDTVTNFGNVYMGLAWVVPLSLIIGLKIGNWKVVFNVIYFIFQLMIIVFVISLFFHNSYVKWAWLLRPVNLILLVGLYRFSIFRKLNIFIIIGVYIIVALLVKQRMDLLFLAITFCFLLLDKVFTIKIRQVFLKYILTSILLIYILVFTVGYEFVSGIVSNIIEFQDSRTFLFKELYADFNHVEKYIGRGSLGSYYSDFFERTRRYYEFTGEKSWAGDVPDRITVEVGYLQMMLKGGLILVVLNIGMYVSAIYFALFRSNNKFIKRLGYYILIIAILSMVSLRPAFSPTFIFFWIAIGTVLNKRYRHMSDKEINKAIEG